MARISRAQKEQNLAEYNQLILNIFLTEGWDSVTYDRLSKELNLRKSTLQGYYPSNQHFAQAIQGKILPLVLEQLDFSSRDTLVASWIEGLKVQHFKMIMKMFVSYSVKPEPNPQIAKGVGGLMMLVQQRLPEEDAKALTQQLFGITITECLGI